MFTKPCVSKNFVGLELVHEYEADKLEIICITSNKELAIAGSFGIIKESSGQVRFLTGGNFGLEMFSSMPNQVQRAQADVVKFHNRQYSLDGRRRRALDLFCHFNLYLRAEPYTK